MNILPIDQPRAATLERAMRTLHARPDRLPERFLSAEIEPQVAMLVEPQSGHPYVFLPRGGALWIDGTQWQFAAGTIVQFERDPGDGRSRLRQRLLAAVFFSRAVAQSYIDAARASSREAMAKGLDGAMLLEAPRKRA